MAAWVVPAVTTGIGLLSSLFAKKPKATQTTTPNLLDWFGNEWGGTDSSMPDWLPKSDSIDLWKNSQTDLSEWMTGKKGTVNDFWKSKGYALDGGGLDFYQLGKLPGEGSGSNPLDDIRSKFMDLLDSQIQDFNNPVGSFNIRAPHVSASHMTAKHAQAALIDMLDKAFNEEPAANLREDVYSRLKSGASAGADDNIRKIMDSARSSGAGPNAPWVQQLMSESRNRANQESTQGLTDFFDSYVTAALARRAAALAQNSETQTNVNMFNASADNSASQFNASSSNAAAMLNAQLAAQTQYQSASLNQQANALRDSRANNLLETLYQLTLPINAGSTTSTTGGTSRLPAITDLATNILKMIEKAKGGGAGTPESVWV